MYEPPKIDIHPKPIFPNIMMVITGTFRNTSNHLPYEITVFSTGSSAYQIITMFMKALSLMLMVHEL